MAEAATPERVLVTGANGFLASHIIKQLQEKGYQVRGTVRSLENENKTKHIKELVPDAAHPVELLEAELTKEDGWKSAVEGCTYVIHTASPFPLASPPDENEVITPAVEGVKNVLKACKEAKCVKRVVMTSAGLAIIGYMRGGEFTEENWPENEDELDAYAKSKTKAEKEAWEFVKNLEDGEKFELAAIHPTAILGPVLHNSMGTSMEIVKRILIKNPPMIPKLNIPVVDVRDVAKAHVVAMTEPEAAGKRHIVSTSNIWWSEIAAHIAEEFKPQGYKIASMSCPKIGIQVAAIFDKDVKAILPNWNKITKLDNTRMKEVLKITEPIDPKTSVIDMAYSMIDGGFVKKTAKYRGRDWRNIFEKEKAEKDAAKAEKDAAKAEKIAAKRASKLAKSPSKKVNGDAVIKGNGEAEAVKENGDAIAEGEDKKEEGTVEKKEDEAETKDEAGKEETKDEAKDDKEEDKKETAATDEKDKDESEDVKKEEEPAKETEADKPVVEEAATTADAPAAEEAEKESAPAENEANKEDDAPAKAEESTDEETEDKTEEKTEEKSEEKSEPEPAEATKEDTDASKSEDAAKADTTDS